MPDQVRHDGMELDPRPFIISIPSMERVPCVYLLANGFHGTLYTGVTSAPLPRWQQHRTAQVRGFTSDYGVKMLVWFEQHATMEEAILREKRIKKWNRAWKLELIEATNPDWRDLAEDFGLEPLE